MIQYKGNNVSAGPWCYIQDQDTDLQKVHMCHIKTIQDYIRLQSSAGLHKVHVCKHYKTPQAFQDSETNKKG